MNINKSSIKDILTLNQSDILNIISDNPNVYLDLPLEIQENPEYLIHYLKEINYSSDLQNKKHFNAIPKKLLKNISFSHQCIDVINDNRIIVLFFKALNKAYKSNIPTDTILHGIKKEGIIIQYANDTVCNDYDIARQAVKNNGFALGHLSLQLRDNIHIVKEAVLSNPDYAQSIFYLCSQRIREQVGKENPSAYFSKIQLAETLDLTLNEQPTNKKNKI